jgi:hypothetical protein
VVKLLIHNLDDREHEKKLYSTSCATRYFNGIPQEIVSNEGCYVKYDLFEPSQEGFYDPYYKVYHRQRMIIGKYPYNMENKVYRYTGVYFFGEQFNKMLSVAEEMELKFELSRVMNQHIGLDDDIDEAVFNNNILIKGHSFGSYRELVNDWETKGYNEFKYNTSCPFMQSIHKEIKQALKNNVLSFTIKIDNSLIKEFERYNVKGLQVYCHNSIDGCFGILDTCKVKITKFKNFYNNYFVSSKSVVIKNKKIYDDPYQHIGNFNNYRFYFFEDLFAEALERASEMTVTFNLFWTSPTKLQANALDINTNYLNKGSAKNAVILKGHTFKNLNEVEVLNTREEIFADYHGLSVYNSFNKAIKEGHTTYTFVLKQEDIEKFKEQGIKGLYIGIAPNGIGMLKVAEVCNVCITKYKEDHTPLFVESDSLSWINENLPCFIGANSKISEGSFSAYYFFDENLYYALHNNNIENISVRIMFTDDVRPIDGIYQLCYHNFSNLEDAQKNFDNKKHILGMFKLTNFDSDHRDIILSRNQIDILKEAKGLCVCSKDNNNFAISFNKMIVFIDYAELENENYYTREFENITCKTFIRETEMLYDNQFICGNNDNEYKYMPFAFIGDNFKHFINNERVSTIEITISTDNKKHIDGRDTTDFPMHVDFFCHNISKNKENYELYKYTDYLFTIDLKNSYTTTIVLNNKQFETLKNGVGLGAVIRNNVMNDRISIQNIKIKVTYIK